MDTFKNRIVSLLKGLKIYLLDWKNLLGHAIVGVFFLIIAIWAPINLYIKLGVIICLVTFNIWRMKKKSHIVEEDI